MLQRKYRKVTVYCTSAKSWWRGCFSDTEQTWPAPTITNAPVCGYYSAWNYYFLLLVLLILTTSIANTYLIRCC